MEYTDVRNGDMITRTYENGVVVEFASGENPTVIPPQVYEPTNAEVAQMISDLQADLIIAGVI